MNQTNTHLTNARHWDSAAKSLWICALIIGICQIVSTILPLTWHEYPTVVDTNLMYDYDTNPHAYHPSYEIVMGDNPYDMVTMLTISILSLAVFITQWVQFAYLGTWLNILSWKQNNTYTHLRRYRLGMLIMLISITAMILLSAIAVLLKILHAGGGPEVAFTLNIIPLCGIMAGGIFQLIGTIGMAFSTTADRDMSSGMKIIISSYIVSILIYTIFVVLIGVGNLDEIQMWLTNLPFILLAVPILQVVGWRKICKAQYPYSE